MENQSELKWYQKPTSVIILLILFFPIGLYLMWKNELWTKPTRWIITGVIILLVLANAGNKNKRGGSDNSSNYNTESNSENNSGSSESEEVSKDVYRQGYADGQTGYGLPASERASASEFYMSRGYNFSSADYPVYEMGYNDGVYGNPKQY